MTRYVALVAFLLVIIAGAVMLMNQQDPVPAAADVHGDEPELAEAMASMQYYTHKLALSLEAENSELAGFYLHELEELAEAVADDIPEYEGHRIGELVEAMLVPEIEALEERLAAGTGSASIEGLIRACNDCHATTDHGFIVIESTDANPYMQDFAPRR